MSSTHRGAERSPNDHYGTPGWATDAILPHIPLAGRIIDAGAGEGQITARLLAAGVPAERIVAVELDPERAEICRAACPGVRVVVGDYLSEEVWVEVCDADTVIMNPPYEVPDQPGCTAYAFVRQSTRLVGARGTVTALLRLNWLEGAQVGEPERFEFLKRNMPDSHVLSRRPQFGVLNKHGKKGHDSCAYAWMVWGPGRIGRQTLLECAPAERVTRSRSARAA